MRTLATLAPCAGAEDHPDATPCRYDDESGLAFVHRGDGPPTYYAATYPECSDSVTAYCLDFTGELIIGDLSAPLCDAWQVCQYREASGAVAYVLAKGRITP